MYQEKSKETQMNPREDIIKTFRKPYPQQKEIALPRRRAIS